MMPLLRAFGHILRYLFCVTFLVSTLGAVLITLLPILFLSKRGSKRWNYAAFGWLMFDIFCAWFCYGTTRRTISGIIGERAYKKQGKRYEYLENLIDWLATLFGDRPRHCFRAFKWEERNVGHIYGAF